MTCCFCDKNGKNHCDVFKYQFPRIQDTEGHNKCNSICCNDCIKRIGKLRFCPICLPQFIDIVDAGLDYEKIM